MKKGYLVEGSRKTRVLIETNSEGKHNVFIPSHGWSFGYAQIGKLVIFPGQLKARCKDWNHSDWWEKNWKLDSWTWCYSKGRES